MTNDIFTTVFSLLIFILIILTCIASYLGFKIDCYNINKQSKNKCHWHWYDSIFGSLDEQRNKRISTECGNHFYCHDENKGSIFTSTLDSYLSYNQRSGDSCNKIKYCQFCSKEIDARPYC